MVIKNAPVTSPTPVTTPALRALVKAICAKRAKEQRERAARMETDAEKFALMDAGWL